MADTLSVDILMVTHRRPAYTRLSLRHLLDSCDDSMRVWVWHNGNDVETLDVVGSMREHDRFHAFHHSRENEFLRAPTNWLFEHSEADLLSLVNDDCVVSDGWARTLRAAHHDVPDFGVVACWHFQPQDFVPTMARRKIREFPGGRRLLVNPWVQGSGIMIKRCCVNAVGLVRPGERGFTSYCLRVAAAGWINGWHLPLVPIDHMDDPRSSRSLLRTDADLSAHLPLSARFRNVETIDQWVSHLQRSARVVQKAPTHPLLYVGLGRKLRRTWGRLRGKELLY
jgi:GT2 family glycosyltransferase